MSKEQTLTLGKASTLKKTQQSAAAQKLEEAQGLLKALGLPKKQYNQRSAWVLLALAHIRPQDRWQAAQTPLLPTVAIMQFIREHYGRDYKPNSRETIRRQTLHQFEQARIVDRNRDDPARATNSKDNNYSLNQPIIEVLQAFPNGAWLQKIEDYQAQLHDLQARYQRRLDREKIPIRLPNGQAIALSPGQHNQLHAAIVHEFCPRFIGGCGRVLYLGDTASSRNEGGKHLILEATQLHVLGVAPMSHEKLPDLIVYDEEREWLFLIEAVTTHGPISPKRWVELEKALETCKVGRVYVTAFLDTTTFRRYAADIAWETEVWIAETPDHMIHFNGDRFLGPHQTS